MGNKKYTILWAASLLVICCVVIFWAICRLRGIELTDSTVRVMGVLDLIAIPALGYATVKMRQ